MFIIDRDSFYWIHFYKQPSNLFFFFFAFEILESPCLSSLTVSVEKSFQLITKQRDISQQDKALGSF